MDPTHISGMWTTPEHILSKFVLHLLELSCKRRENFWVAQILHDIVQLYNIPALILCQAKFDLNSDPECTT